MKTTYFNGETIVAFHIGRGGRFYNAGHLTFEGAHEISFYADDLFPASIEDENGEVIDDPDEDAEFHDECGNSVGLTNAEFKSGIGIINRDGEYNTTYTKYLKDVEEDSDEWKAIFADNTFDGEQAQMVLRPELAINTIEELADFINEHNDWELIVNDIIEKNGWYDNTGDDYGICEDNDYVLSLDENGNAVITEID